MKTDSILVIISFLFTTPFIFAEDKAKPILLDMVKVENNQSQPKSTTVVKITGYRPTTSIYIVRGKVQYRDVEGTAYLEMWNIMPDGSRYFSRTVQDDGPMRLIQGSSDWRTFELPFNLMGAKPESVTLEINVVMSGKGTIELSELTVSDIPTSADKIGGLVGILLFCYFCYVALLACLSGFLVPCGKGRRLIFGMIICAEVIGFIYLFIGILAVRLGQPYHVWGAFILCGGLMVFIYPVCYPMMRMLYERAELRKIQALDA